MHIRTQNRAKGGMEIHFTSTRTDRILLEGEEDQKYADFLLATAAGNDDGDDMQSVESDDGMPRKKSSSEKGEDYQASESDSGDQRIVIHLILARRPLPIQTVISQLKMPQKPKEWVKRRTQTVIPRSRWRRRKSRRRGSDAENHKEKLDKKLAPNLKLKMSPDVDDDVMDGNEDRPVFEAEPNPEPMPKQKADGNNTDDDQPPSSSIHLSLYPIVL
ncbi:hypothetical protein JOM56_010716 [Amanita muscaria]